MDLERRARHLRHKALGTIADKIGDIPSSQARIKEWNEAHPQFATVLSLLDRHIGVQAGFRHVAELHERARDVQELAQGALDQFHVTVEWDEPRPQWTMTPGVRTIVYGNHNKWIEPIAVTSQIDRPDLRFVGSFWTSVIGQKVRDVLFPVMVIPDGGKTMPFKGVLYDRRAAFTFNIKTLKDAATAAANGSAVVIFPLATHLEDPNVCMWNGINRIVRDMDRQALEETVFAPLYFYGPRSGLLRNIHAGYTGRTQTDYTFRIAQGDAFTGKDILQMMQDGNGRNVDGTGFMHTLHRLYVTHPSFNLIEKKAS